MEQDVRVQKFQMAELVPQGTRAQEPHDCSELQRHAFEQGRQKGIEEGRAQCQAKVDEELTRAIHLANQIGRARVVALEEQERDIVEVALAISHKIILREVETDKELIVRQVRQILGLLLNASLVTLKVHPDDLEVLEPLHQALQAEFVDGDHLVIEGHEDVQPGGCLVEQAGLQLDARLHQQLETVAAEFGLEHSHS
ncbi:MAG: FliH/SctL family protein [Nitrospirota bacterium]|nr:FliH/SctL family protein [Nitrospirota bacterium]